MSLIICSHCGAPGELPSYLMKCSCGCQGSDELVPGACPECDADSLFTFYELRNLGVKILTCPKNPGNN